MTANPVAPVYCYNRGSWAEPWWVDRTHLMYRLAQRGWPVVYTSGPLSVWEHGSDEWNAAGWLGSATRLPVDADRRLLIDRPGRLLASWPRLGLWDDLVVQLHARRLRRLQGDASNGESIAFTCHPTFLRHTRSLATSKVVLHVYDAWRDNASWTAELDRQLHELVERADLITALTREQADALPGDAPARARILPHGIDAAVFRRALTVACPPALAAIPEPRIGYFGRISQKIDLALILELAQRRRDWNWVFVGLDIGLNDRESSALWRRLGEQRNVYLLGFQPAELVPVLMCHMSALTLPFKSSGRGYWNAIFSLKTYEYLATGLPVVGSQAADSERMSTVIARATTCDEWESELERALEHGGVGTRPSRQALAFDYDNSWDKRTDDLEDWIRDLL